MTTKILLLGALLTIAPVSHADNGWAYATTGLLGLIVGSSISHSYVQPQPVYQYYPPVIQQPIVQQVPVYVPTPVYSYYPRTYVPSTTIEPCYYQGQQVREFDMYGNFIRWHHC